MGFDIYGIEPKNEAGEYFRNNIWWWPRLWDFCCLIAPKLTGEDQKCGSFNDGHLIEGEKHKSLVANLKKALENREKLAHWISASEESYMDRKHWAEKLTIDGNGEIQMSDSDNSEIDNGEKCRFSFDCRNVERFFVFVDNNNGFEIW